MPVVTVAVPTLESVGTLLQAVANRSAQALGLADGDVIAVHVPTGASAASGGDVREQSSWAVVSFHGSDRGEEKTAAARQAGNDAVEEWARHNQVSFEGVWTEWVKPV